MKDGKLTAHDVKLIPLTHITKIYIIWSHIRRERRLRVMPEMQKRIEHPTKNQSKCNLCQFMFIHLLSNCFMLHPPSWRGWHWSQLQWVVLLQEIFCKCIKICFSFDYPANVWWGKSVRSKFMQKSCPNIHVVESGLWIDTNRGWLATSPDGIAVNDKGEYGRHCWN